ncbi:MAG: NifB/NifX family molybdenum-iron cluster-binding protein [Desulfovibrionaceae bacterium]|nr:NifB/NifX family molybdenum-iron cluster-binding protein [Desulfovibrionaceae bacterium]
MKIAVSSQGQNLESPVDPRFGRTSGFVVYDTETEGCQYVDNAQNLSLPQGAGIQAAQNVAGAGAGAVITGHIGPKAFLALEKGGVAIFLKAEGSVGEAIKDFRDGRLQKAGGPDREGHWV